MSMTINSIATQNIQRNMQQISTGQRINSASDNAAGMAQAQALSAQINGLNQGMNNTADMSNLVSTAEGATGIINAGLRRVEELTIQAQNGTLSERNVATIQNEVNEIMSGINQISQNTQFNGRPLLNGDANNLNTASSPNGTGQQISIPDLSTEALGLDNFNVSSPNSINDVRQAMSTVNSARAGMGAAENRLQYTMNSNSITSLNLASARSRIVDTDMARAASEKQRNELVQEYSINMQRDEMEQENTRTQSIFL